jgi:hypothetical protein
VKHILVGGAALLVVAGSLVGGEGDVSAFDAQPAIHGRGTPGFIARFRTPTRLEDSSIFETDDSVVIAENSANVGIGVATPSAKLHLSSGFPGGGPTLNLENSDAAGDVAIDFLSNGEFLGNLGLSREPEANRFFVLQNNPQGMPLTLAEEGGNVGVGTRNPQSALQVVGYTQLDVTIGVPPAADCDDAAERGRMKVDSVGGSLYICVDAGWVGK